MNIWLTIFGPTTHGEDPAAVAAGIRKAGANSLIVYSSLYMGYRLLQRRYPQKPIYSLEADRVFWEPDLSFYEDCSIKPQRSIDAADQDLLADLSGACKTEGLAFSTLMPVCAGQRLVQDRPDLAVTNLYGSQDRLLLCYNNPEVQAYRLAMVRDIASRYEIDALMLDKIPQTMLETRAFSGMFDAPLRTVGSFCFCKHCQREAERRSLDLNEVQSKAKEIAERSLRIPAHIIESLGNELGGDTEIPLLLLEEPLLRKMLEFRFETAVDFTAKLAQAARLLRPNISVQAAFVPPGHAGHDHISPRAWLTVQSYKFYAGVVDEIHCVVHREADVVRFETERAVAMAKGKTNVVTAMRLYGATRPEEVASLAEAALAGGSRDLHFLGYDVATNELLEALGRWSRDRGN